MKKLVVATAFAAFAFAAHSATACDWNRQASAKDPAVASANKMPQVTPTCTGANCPAPQPTGVASEQTPNAVDEAAPIVLITTRK